MSYLVPQPYKCTTCGHEMMYTSSVDVRHPAPAVGDTVCCPVCWEEFLKKVVGGLECTRAFTGPLSSYEIAMKKKGFPDTETEGRESCPVIVAHCNYYSYQCDSNGELAIAYCAHPANPCNEEGNCRHSLCPLTSSEEMT